MNDGARLDRRNLIRIGARGTADAAGTTALAGPLVLANGSTPAPDSAPDEHQHGGTTVQNEHGAHDNNLTVGDIDIARLGWDPVDVLTDFDYGAITETRADGTA